MGYIGFRIEIASRVLPATYDTDIDKFNCTKESQIVNLRTNGRITAEKTAGLVIARGKESPEHRSRPGAMVNFGLLVPTGDTKRVVQIVNVLGNDKLIRERVQTFTNGESILSGIPEFENLRGILFEVDKIMPGLINSGWYYAPEALFDK